MEDGTVRTMCLPDMQVDDRLRNLIIAAPDRKQLTLREVKLQIQALTRRFAQRSSCCRGAALLNSSTASS
jgi:hypothetical protein